MNELLLPAVIGASILFAAFAALVQWLRYMSRARAAKLRTQGYGLIRALGAYSAWIDMQRDLPISAQSLDELTSPEPLTLARHIRHESFPELSGHMVRLLQAHSRVIEHLWQQDLLRLKQGSGWRPAHEDSPYLQIRGAQEDLIDEIVQRCRELIGDAREPWHATGSDFSFSNSLRAGPVSRA